MPELSTKHPDRSAPKAQAGTYFTKDVLQLTDGPLSPGPFGYSTVLGLALTWLAVYLSISKGVLRVGKVVMITVPVPLALLVLLAFRGLTLPGAMDGLAYYLTPHWTALLDPNTWVAAYGQVFFSTSVG